MRALYPAAALALLVATAPAAAEDQLGNAAEGAAYARANCAECHGVEPAASDFSPNPDAPDFSVVANTPGMTERALAVWLQTSHPTMPDFILTETARDNLIAYIMSLKTAGKR